ncbi:hypothetical protein V1512DRAFT_277641 [Lipomyces arxii]|uniref:uncharacterized protein n=1 Tax=Lipomyces arxii TaxID=56418 RepID=UPI0034CF8548
MLFKPWLDAPPPRHELHDDSSSDEDIHYESESDYDDGDELFKPVKKEVWSDNAVTVQIDYPEFLPAGNLLLVAPATEPIVLALAKSIPAGSVAISSRSSSQSLAIFRIPEYDLTWIRMPSVAPTTCHNLARTILEAFSPKLTIILTPLYVGTETPVKTLVTTNTSLGFLQEQALRPPCFITGIAASILSFAELAQLPAVALVINAEGVPDHEFVEEEAAESTAAFLAKITARAELTLSLQMLRRHQYRSSGMYV